MSNDELQKAIDDITKGDNVATGSVPTAEVVDPGVASVSLPDDLALNDNTMAGTNFVETPDANAGASGDIFGVPPTPDTSNAMPMDLVNPAVVAAPVAPVENETVAPVVDSAIDLSVTPDFTETTANVGMGNVSAIESISGDLEAVKNAALIELYPLLPTMNVNPRQKFDICMTVIEKTNDKGAASVALDAAKMIPDVTEKGDCLMQLVEAINKL